MIYKNKKYNWVNEKDGRSIWRGEDNPKKFIVMEDGKVVATEKNGHPNKVWNKLKKDK